MTFHMLLSRSVVFNEDWSVKDEIYELVNYVKDYDIKLVIVSKKLRVYRGIIKDEFPENNVFLFAQRGEISKKFTENNKGFLIIGAVDEDIWIAANNKILLINPTWLIEVSEKVEMYGYKLNSFRQVLNCIEILNIETQVYNEFNIDPITKLIAVSNANRYQVMTKEQQMIDTYKNVLKYGKESYKYAVYFHYLTMVIGYEELEDVDYWMAMPSSSGSNENNIYEIVKNTRYLLKNRRKDEMFLRHTPAQKSTYMTKEQRIQAGCKRHFDTIILNPTYEGKLAGKKICVLDDYVTNGTSFESIRNLLKHENVREIIFIAIGTFKQPYIIENYNLAGRLYEPNYRYELLDTKLIRGIANERSTDVIEEIYDIINS